MLGAAHAEQAGYVPQLVLLLLQTHIVPEHTANGLDAAQLRHEPGTPQLEAVPAHAGGVVQTFDKHEFGAAQGVHEGNEPHDVAELLQVQTMPEQIAKDDEVEQLTQEPLLPQLADDPAQAWGGVHTLEMHAFGTAQAEHAGNDPQLELVLPQTQDMPEQLATPLDAVQLKHEPGDPQFVAVPAHGGRAEHALDRHAFGEEQGAQEPALPQLAAVPLQGAATPPAT